MLQGRRVLLPMRLVVVTSAHRWTELNPPNSLGADLAAVPETGKPQRRLDAWELRDDFLRLKNDAQLLGFLNRTGSFMLMGGARRKRWYWEWQRLIRDLVLHKPERWSRMRKAFRPELAEWADPDTRKGLVAELKFRIDSDAPAAEVLVVGVLRGMMASIHIDHLSGAQFGVCERADCAMPYRIESAHRRKYCDPYCAHLESLRRARKRWKSSKGR